VNYLADASIRALPLALVGGLAALALRRAGVQMRHALWLAVTLGMLALPLLVAWLPPLPVTVAAWTAPPALENPLPVEAPAAPAGPPPAPAFRANWLLLAYCAGFAALQARFLHGALRLRRMLAEATPEHVPAAAGAAAALGVDPAAVDIRSHPEARVPFTAGVFRPVILTPPDWRDWPEPKLVSVLAHELAHVARRDWFFARAASLNRCLFWFHPLAWWLDRKLASLAEESADQAALAVVGDRKSYAGAIIDFALAMQGKQLQPMEATAMARSTKVGRRVERILATTHLTPAAVQRGAVLAIVLCALPLLFAAAALTPQPPPPPPPPPAAGLVPFVQTSPVAEDEIARMEAHLRSNPLDADTRLKLLFQYSRTNNAEAMTRHAEFLVESQPEYSGAVMATQMLAGGMNPGMANPVRSESELQRLAEIWRRHASGKSGNAAVLANAAQVLQMARAYFEAEDYLQRARKIEPGNPRYPRLLASLYAGTLLSPAPNDSFASKVKSELETTPDVEVILAAAEQLAPSPAPAFVRTPEQRKQHEERTKLRAGLAGKYLDRAQALGGDGARVQQARDRIAKALSMQPEVIASPLESIAVGGNVQDQMVLEKVPPKYPPLAKQAGISGTVRLTALIGKEGFVKTLTLVSGHPLLAGAAKEAVQQWRYKPTLLNGEPVEVVTQIDVNFTLADGPPPGGIAGGVPGGVGIGIGGGAPGGLSGGVSGGVYRIGGDVSAPIPVSRVEPEYSVEARDAKFQGTVLLKVVIDPDGRPSEIRVVRPLGMGLDQKAIEAVSKWRFKPGMKEGQPVPVEAAIEINFRLLDP
jgi:TonB family protein